MVFKTAAFAATALWLINRPPVELQDYVVALLDTLPGNIGTLNSILKWLFALGLVRGFSSTFTAVALNNWKVFSDSGSWKWDEEVAVVTGGCSGIGEEIVKALAARGVKVAILDISPLPPSLQNVAAHFIRCDVTDSAAIDSAAEEIRSKLGAPSILVNNAGIGRDYPVLEIPPDRVKLLVDVNLTSHFYTLRAFVPDMVKRNKGHVVEIGSMTSFVSVGHFTDYSATKTAILALAEGLREQLRSWYRSPNVHVTTVHPHWVSTPLVAYRKEVIEKNIGGKMMTPAVVGREVANQIFKCRGTILVLPKSMSLVASIRGWPVWVQDLIKSSAAVSREEMERKRE